MNRTGMFVLASLMLAVFCVGVFDYQEREWERKEFERQAIATATRRADMRDIAARMDRIEESFAKSADTLRQSAVDGGAAIEQIRLCESLVVSLTEKVSHMNDNGSMEAEKLHATIAELTLRLAELERQVHGDEGKLGQSTQRVETLFTKVQDIPRSVEELSNKFDVMQRERPSVKPEPSTVMKQQKLILPTVQVSCDREVGSGTIMTSRMRADGGYDTYVLTALHVVEGALAKPQTPMQITTYDGAGETHDFAIELFASKTFADLALLKVRSNEQFPFVAHLAPRETLATIDVFARVYAVGCPLAYPPLPTAGELTSKTKVLGGETYWMLNAPTIFGNSGGGIFLAETGELIGVLSRVSAYNNFINIAVPHMGIFVPAEEIYIWLDEEKLQFIYDEHAALPAGPAKRGGWKGMPKEEKGE